MDINQPTLVGLGAIAGTVLTEIIRRVLPSKEKRLDYDRQNREDDRAAAALFREELRSDILTLRARIVELERENGVLRQQAVDMTLEIARLRSEIIRLQEAKAR